MIDRNEFARQVKDALANLYDPVHLQRHPLLRLLGLKPAPGETFGECLRGTLRETIESLRPASTVTFGRPEWLSYRLLSLHYVQSRDQATTCQELGLSLASYYRRHQEALEAVVSLLWERFVSAPLPQARDESSRYTVEGGAQAVTEVARLARESRRQAVAVDALLAESLQTLLSLSQQQGIAIRISSPPSLPAVYGDPALLHQVFVNVLMETLALAAGASLTLSVVVQGQETVWHVQGLDEAKIGPEREQGVPGFVVGHAVLKEYGGRLWLDKGDDGQPLLFFTIPVAGPRAALVIDDDTSTIELYRRYLQSDNWLVRTAHNTQQLDDQLAESSPDVILLDVLMPQLDGWDILQRLKTRPETAHIPVVICSVLSQPRLALSLGAADVLSKPISAEALLTTIHRLLGQAGI